MDGGAIFDSSGRYRYLLWREWDLDKPRLTFVMLNPSTADATTDDPTIARCISFAKKWKFGSLDVVNLFAYRATEPDVLKEAKDPVGPDNDWYLERSIAAAGKVVIAWGNHGLHDDRHRLIVKKFRSRRFYCLGITKLGQPRHPLYVSSNSPAVLFPVSPK
jgi:hypothetical protein